jgi:type II secretory pathway component PulK
MIAARSCLMAHPSPNVRGASIHAPSRHTPARVRRGSALLAVLWFSAALSAIAFALSMTVRTELDRAALNVDSTRAYFLAQGAIEIAMKRMQERPPQDNPTALGFLPGQRFMRIPFPHAVVDIEIIGDSGKLNVNSAPPQALAHLLAASGLDPSAAVRIAARIVEFRRGPAQAANSEAPSSFSNARTSLKELEELLMVPGVTPDLLYGTYRRNPAGQLVRLGGLYHYLTLRGSARIDANYAPVEVLRAAGLAPGDINRIVSIRAQRPLIADDIRGLTAQNEGFSVGVRGSTTHYTVWATARLSNGRATRTVGARVLQTGGALGVQPVRWFDMAF